MSVTAMRELYPAGSPATSGFCDPGMAGQRVRPALAWLTAASHPGPGRLVRGKLPPQVRHQLGQLAVGHAVLEGRHIAEIARHRGCDAVQDDLDQIVRHGAVQIAVQRQRRPAAEQRRAADRMANRAGALIEPRAGGDAETTLVPVAVSSLAASASCAGLSMACLVERGEIDRHGANILVGQCGEFFHHRRHRAGGDAVKAGFAGAQISEQLILAPGDRRVRQRGQRRRFPAFRETAGQIGLGLFRAERIARRMAGAAMAEALDQIGAAIPCRRFRRVGLE